jgi:multiple sugar transport system substrate-binding protein
MKKGFCLFLCICLICVSLFASGTAEKKNETSKALTWWEHFETLTAMNQGVFADFTQNTGIEVEYTLSSPDKMSDAMLVAFRAKQLPDVLSLPFSDVSTINTMFNEGWFQPLSLDIASLPNAVADSLYEGLTLHNGKVYSLPIFGPNHVALTFYHPSMVNEDDIPTTYQEFYESCKKVYEESNGKIYGLVLPMTFTTRMDETFKQLMDAAGKPVVDYVTGAYQYNSDEMIELFGLLIRMWDEGLIHPSSVNFNMKQARERWAAGEAAYLIDGIWNVGITKMNFDSDLSDFAVTEPLRPEVGDYMIYKVPNAGTYYVSSSSRYADEASSMLLRMLDEEYQIKLADVMDQPPVDLSVLEKADVHPSYIEGCDIFTQSMGNEPYPILKNINTSRVYAAMRTISPTPCEILNGYFSGAIKDWKSELSKYNTAMEKERNIAIEKVKADGYAISLEDWKFPNFVYGESYTNEKYKEL